MLYHIGVDIKLAAKKATAASANGAAADAAGQGCAC